MRAAKKEKKSSITEKMSVKITYIANFSIKLFKVHLRKERKLWALICGRLQILFHNF